MVCKPAYFTWHGGREQQRLALPWETGKEISDLRHEAQVHHLIGLIEHHGLGLVKSDVLGLEVIVKTTRGGHEDVDAGHERANLRASPGATNDQGRREVKKFPVAADALENLRCELTGGRQDERLTRFRHER